MNLDFTAECADRSAHCHMTGGGVTSWDRVKRTLPIMNSSSLSLYTSTCAATKTAKFDESIANSYRKVNLILHYMYYHLLCRNVSD